DCSAGRLQRDRAVIVDDAPELVATAPSSRAAGPGSDPVLRRRAVRRLGHDLTGPAANRSATDARVAGGAGRPSRPSGTGPVPVALAFVPALLHQSTVALYALSVLCLQRERAVLVYRRRERAVQPEGQGGAGGGAGRAASRRNPCCPQRRR